MAKLTKKALKGLVKECLIEILSEGISPDTLNESKMTRKKKNSPEREFLTRKSVTDKISFAKTAKIVSENLTEDPIMQSIFADTAQTTLQQQTAASKMPSPLAGADRAAQIVSQTNPEDLFEGNSNWASLAFADKTPGPKQINCLNP